MKKDDLTLINEVIKQIPNKYMAVIVAAKRARELNMGIRPLIKADAKKPTTVALLEIAEGLIVPGPAKPEPLSISMGMEKKPIISARDLVVETPSAMEEESIVDTVILTDRLIKDEDKEEDYE